MFGRKLAPESLQKQKATLQKNHPGITNAFFLAKHRTKSKMQKSVFEWLTSTFPQHGFAIEKVVDTTKFYADAISMSQKLIVECHGSYWHCDPRKYDRDYFHEKKGMLASEVWACDIKRLTTFQDLGYNVFVLWEDDFKCTPWQEKLANFIEENSAKEEDIDALRPSVINYSSADVKLGELLGSRNSNATT